MELSGGDYVVGALREGASSPRSSFVPIADVGPDRTVRSGETFLLDGSRSRDPDGEVLTYRWTGYGTNPAERVFPWPDPISAGMSIASDEVSPSCRCTVPGDYVFALHVTDGSTESTDNVVIHVGPQAAIGVRSARWDRLGDEPKTVMAPGDTLVVASTGSVGPADGTSLERRWDWEDDGVWDTEWGSLDTARHVYSEAGVHWLRLEVRDCTGATGDTTAPLIVAEEERLSTRPDITLELPGGALMRMVYIPPGAFIMGASDRVYPRLEDAEPQHAVVVSRGFYLGKYELTQGQWQGAMGTAPWSEEEYVQEDPQCPAASISWDDVQTLVDTPNAAAGDSVYRLPTEAEWEYACRAGTTTEWSFGDDESRLPEYAWSSTQQRPSCADSTSARGPP